MLASLLLLSTADVTGIACVQCVCSDLRDLLICRCSSGYDMRQYPADMPVAHGVTLGVLNTQVAEQVNALLEHVRTQVSLSCQLM